MSNSLFPTLPGLSWNVTRQPIWNTVVQTAASGREYRASMWTYPKWSYKLSYEVLRGKTAVPEMQTLAAFFNGHRGSWDSWLFVDPDDNSATNQPIGTGDGTNKLFQLVRSFGGYLEPVFEPGTYTIYVNGSARTPGTHFSQTNGLITFVTAPAPGAAVTWTGTFRWRCRFLQDQLEFNQFMRQLWELRRVEFITVRP